MSARVRVLLLVAAVLIVFGSVTAVLLQVLPGPHRDADYLVIGVVATLVSLLALFVVLITEWIKAPDVFYKRRKK